jgi:hypothetical protein
LKIFGGFELYWRGLWILINRVMRIEETRTSGSCSLSKSVWHAFYFESLEREAVLARTLIIEAESEEEAGKLATEKMGRCMRVHVTRPVWGAPDGARPTILENERNVEID